MAGVQEGAGCIPTVVPASSTLTEVQKDSVSICYHQVSICYVVFDQPSTQDDHSSLLGPHCLAVDAAYVCNQMCIEHYDRQVAPQSAGLISVNG